MNIKTLSGLVGLFCCLLLANTVLAAAEKKPDERAEYIRSHYAKYEYQIAMRDGVKLFTSVYIPYDKSVKLPMLMQRTPYRVAPYGIDKYKKH